MDCRVISEDLFAYALGSSSDEVRDRIDAHLLGCTSCLRAYLRLKHHVERGASLSARPSDAIRRRIRTDVAPRPWRPAAARRGSASGSAARFHFTRGSRWPPLQPASRSVSCT